LPMHQGIVRRKLPGAVFQDIIGSGINRVNSARISRTFPEWKIVIELKIGKCFLHDRTSIHLDMISSFDIVSLVYSYEIFVREPHSLIIPADFSRNCMEDRREHRVTSSPNEKKKLRKNSIFNPFSKDYMEA
jgi:hypothetical protein